MDCKYGPYHPAIKYKFGGTGPTLMAVLKNTKKGKAQDKVYTTLA
jgi:hypothetical protein